MKVLKDCYPELFSFICGLHKMRNIIKKINIKDVG